MSQLIHTYELQGCKDEAEELRVQVFEIRKKSLGLKHPDILKTMSQIADGYEIRGRTEEAKELRVHVVERRKKICGRGIQTH